jgi:hypothetical protein
MSLCDLKLNTAEAPVGRSAISTTAAAPIKSKRLRLATARNRPEAILEKAIISHSSRLALDRRSNKHTTATAKKLGEGSERAGSALLVGARACAN